MKLVMEDSHLAIVDDVALSRLKQTPKDLNNVQLLKIQPACMYWFTVQSGPGKAETRLSALSPHGPSPISSSHLRLQP